jgi:predicted Zn-dependent peptidase
MKHCLASWLLACALTITPLGTLAAQGPQLPPSLRVTLTNGLTVLLMEQHEVPLVSFQFVIRAGGVVDPPGREGLALLTADLLQHGTTHRTADQIAAELDNMGGSFSASGDADRVCLSGEFMQKDVPVALDLMCDLLQHPTFPAPEVKKLVRQRVDGIRQDKEEAGAVLPRYFCAALFGSHPYGRPTGGDERSLAAIRRRDVADFYQKHYGPKTTILAVAGDFAPAEMERLVTVKLGPWRSRAAAATNDLPDAPPFQARKLLLVNKPDSPQTYFAIGQVGVARNNPDRTGLDLVNLLFGGRFTSMLNDALRVNSGLTYGAHAQFHRHRAAGSFVISSFTPTATTTNAIDMALDVLERLHRDGISEEQLESARNYLKGQFPPHIETPGQLAALLADLEFYGLDAREVNDLFPRIDAFTTADARRLIQRYFPRENLVFTLIGKTADIEAAVARYAPRIEKLEIDQPGFK